MLPSDFPSTDDIKRKLTSYEAFFTKAFVSRFSDLPRDVQLNAAVIALEVSTGRYLSLLTYMQSSADVIPLDLTSDDRYALTVPVSLLHGIVHVRRDKIADEKLWASQARDVIACVAMEAANELTRIYEYQIALMYDDVSMRIIADHAVDCVMEHIQNSQFIERNSAIYSVACVYPQNVDGTRKFISGVIGNKELKWDLYEVYKAPGLRKELTMMSDARSDSGIDSPAIEPWRFHYSDTSQPFLYGYRGQTIEWCYVTRSYRLDSAENERFKQEIAQQTEDYHRLYMPYKRLVGYDVMQSYCSKPVDSERPSALADVLKTDVTAGACERDEIQPVYRPLVVNTLNCDNAVLDNVDLTRANLTDADLRATSAQNAKLLLADIGTDRLEQTRLDGADISYSNVQARELSPDSLKVMTARHVLLSEAGEPAEGEPDAQAHSPVSSIPSPKSPGLNTSFVSDGDGRVFTVPQGEPVDLLVT